MLLVEEQRLLIAKLVRENKNYHGNEDLFEDFCSESFQKSYMMFNSDNTVEKIESYIRKVVHTSILSVLKNSGRIRRISQGYISTNEIKIADIHKPDVKKESSVDVNYILEFPDPKQSPEEILITKDCLQRIADAVCVIHKELPSKYFYDIFYLRYIKSYKQSEIATELNLSQSEISKRLMELSKLISNFLDGKRN